MFINTKNFANTINQFYTYGKCTYEVQHKERTFFKKKVDNVSFMYYKERMRKRRL